MSASDDSFRAAVYAAAARIPRGAVATYGQVAALAGRPRAARAVGSFMARNRDPRVPCHRVVAANGALAGYAFGGAAIKRAKLEAEGVAFTGARADLARSRWSA